MKLKKQSIVDAPELVAPPVFVPTPPASRGKSKLVFWLAGIALIAIVWGAYAAIRLSKLTPASQENAAKVETQELIAKVGELMFLPTDEEPTVATVSDVEKLREQAFFLHAKNGDKVLIYAKASKAILYDPVANKIVEVAPINFGALKGSPNTSAVSTKTSTSTKK